MNKNICDYINYLFRHASQSKEIQDIKEEMILDISMKYDSYIQQGFDDEAAFLKSISNIGDVNQIINEIDINDETRDESGSFFKKNKKYYRLLKSVSIGLFILAFIPVILDSESSISVALMFFILAVAIGILVYISGNEKLTSNKQDINFEYKDKVPSNYAKAKKINTLVNGICICFYFVLSVLTQRWDLTWIIFVIMAISNSMISALFEVEI